MNSELFVLAAPVTTAAAATAAAVVATLRPPPAAAAAVAVCACVVAATALLSVLRAAAFAQSEEARTLVKNVVDALPKIPLNAKLKLTVEGEEARAIQLSAKFVDERGCAVTVSK